MKPSRVIQMARSVNEALVIHCQKAMPFEACGFLSGQVQPTGAKRITRIFPITNANPSPRTFQMDPGEQRAAEIEIRNLGLECLGLFHSHPTSPAFPSRTDVARAHWEGTEDLLYRDWSWVIVSLETPHRPVVRSFRILGPTHPQDLEEEQLLVD